MQEIVHPFDCDCDRCTVYDEDGNPFHWNGTFQAEEVTLEE